MTMLSLYDARMGVMASALCGGSSGEVHSSRAACHTFKIGAKIRPVRITYVDSCYMHPRRSPFLCAGDQKRLASPNKRDSPRPP